MFDFIHITDLHILPPGEINYGLDPALRLRHAVESIAARHGPGSAAPADPIRRARLRATVVSHPSRNFCRYSQTPAQFQVESKRENASASSAANTAMTSRWAAVRCMR